MSQFPQIAIYEGVAQIANCANENFEPKLGFWELKCTAVDLDFPFFLNKIRFFISE